MTFPSLGQSETKHSAQNLPATRSFFIRRGQAGGSQLNSCLILAKVLDGLISNSGPLQARLKSPKVKNLNQAIQRLNPELGSLLKRQVGERGLEEVKSLAGQSNSRLFYRSLLQWAERRQGEGRIAAAQIVYNYLLQIKSGPTQGVLSDQLRTQARENLAVLNGGGPLGKRLEFQAQRFIQEATAPSMIVGMALGSTVFTGVRSLILPRLLASRGGGILTIGFGARLTASSIALVPEVGAFWGVSKGIHELQQPGSQKWDWATNAQELKGLALTLGLLKSTGFAFARGHQWAAQMAKSGKVGHFTQALAGGSLPLWQQGGMLTGITLAHGAEMALGWRPAQSLDAFMVDSLITLAHFNAGGALSHKFFPSLYRFNAKLHRKMHLQEHRQLNYFRHHPHWDRLREFFTPGNGPGDGWGGLKTASALAALGNVESSSRLPHLNIRPHKGLQEAKDLNSLMSDSDRPKGPVGPEGPQRPQFGEQDGGEGAMGPPENFSPKRDEFFGEDINGAVQDAIERAPTTDRLPPYPTDVDQLRELLPYRQGGEKDPFETSGSKFPFPRDMLNRLLVKAQDSLGEGLGMEAEGPQLAVRNILKELGNFKESELTQPPGEKLNNISESDLGFGLAKALKKGMSVFLEPGLEQYDGKRITNLNPELQSLIRGLDELVGIEKYAQRAGKHEVIFSFEKTLGEEGLLAYNPLQEGLVELLSPKLGRQGDVFGPRDAIVSIGNGDMMGLLALFRHRIMPGQLSWRTRLFATARKPYVAREINEKGLFLTGDKALGRDKRINFRQDPPIEVIPRPPKGENTEEYDYKKIDPEDVLKQVQLQMINVPSKNLHEVLTPEYIRNLPEGAHIFEVIKGFIGSDRGAYAPQALVEQPSMLPFELINLALKKHGRSDVRVVSGGGFIPGKDLWYNRPGVRMTFAGPEEPEDTGRSPAADFVARAFAGRDRKTHYIEATTTHHQRSTEIGGALKNIASVQGGIQSVFFNFDNLSRDLTKRDYDVALEHDIIRPLHELMKDTLALEGIRSERIGFRPEVEEDFKSCLEIDLPEVRTLVQEAMNFEPRIFSTTDNFIGWIQRRIIDRRYILAPTRNTVLGIVIGITHLLNTKRGASLDILEIVRRIEKGLTAEGVDSLPPVVMRNNFHGQSIELRRHRDTIYDLHDLLYPGGKAHRPPLIQSSMKSALDGKVPGIDSNELRWSIDKAMDPERTVDILTSEFDRYTKLREQSLRMPQDARIAMALTRQKQLLPILLEAMKEGGLRMIMDFPYYFPPYENMVRIMLTPKGQEARHIYSYVRVNGEMMMDRLTQLGIYLRSLGEGTRMRLDIDATHISGRENLQKDYEIKETTKTILDAFLGYYNRSPDKNAHRTHFEMNINDTYLSPVKVGRDPFEADKYYPALEPLVRRLNANSPETPIKADDIRRARAQHSQVLNDFITREIGWPMTLGYFGGPIQRGIKAGLARPENQTMIGIYAGGQLVETFMIYRNHQNQAMALNHSVMSQLSKVVGEGFTEKYSDLNSVNYFEGLPLEQFLNDYEAMARLNGTDDPLTYRIMDLKSLPLERALANRLENINPAELRLFLQEETPARQAMLTELNRFYEMNLDEARSEVVKIIKRYTEGFHERLLNLFQTHPLYAMFEPLYHEFQNHGRKTFHRLIERRGSLERGERITDQPGADEE